MYDAYTVGHNVKYVLITFIFEVNGLFNYTKTICVFQIPELNLYLQKIFNITFKYIQYRKF